MSNIYNKVLNNLKLEFENVNYNVDSKAESDDSLQKKLDVDYNDNLIHNADCNDEFYDSKTSAIDAIMKKTKENLTETKLTKSDIGATENSLLTAVGITPAFLTIDDLHWLNPTSQEPEILNVIGIDTAKERIRFNYKPEHAMGRNLWKTASLSFIEFKDQVLDYEKNDRKIQNFINQSRSDELDRKFAAERNNRIETYISYVTADPKQHVDYELFNTPGNYFYNPELYQFLFKIHKSNIDFNKQLRPADIIRKTPGSMNADQEAFIQYEYLAHGNSTLDGTMSSADLPDEIKQNLLQGKDISKTKRQRNFHERLRDKRIATKVMSQIGNIPADVSDTTILGLLSGFPFIGGLALLSKLIGYSPTFYVNKIKQALTELKPKDRHQFIEKYNALIEIIPPKLMKLTDIKTVENVIRLEITDADESLKIIDKVIKKSSDNSEQVENFEKLKKVFIDYKNFINDKLIERVKINKDIEKLYNEFDKFMDKVVESYKLGKLEKEEEYINSQIKDIEKRIFENSNQIDDAMKKINEYENVINRLKNKYLEQLSRKFMDNLLVEIYGDSDAEKLTNVDTRFNNKLRTLKYSKVLIKTTDKPIGKYLYTVTADLSSDDIDNSRKIVQIATNYKEYFEKQLNDVVRPLITEINKQLDSYLSMSSKIVDIAVTNIPISQFRRLLNSVEFNKLFNDDKEVLKCVKSMVGFGKNTQNNTFEDISMRLTPANAKHFIHDIEYIEHKLNNVIDELNQIIKNNQDKHQKLIIKKILTPHSALEINDDFLITNVDSIEEYAALFPPKYIKLNNSTVESVLKNSGYYLISVNDLYNSKLLESSNNQIDELINNIFTKVLVEDNKLNTNDKLTAYYKEHEDEYNLTLASMIQRVKVVNANEELIDVRKHPNDFKVNISMPNMLTFGNYTFKKHDNSVDDSYIDELQDLILIDSAEIERTLGPRHGFVPEVNTAAMTSAENLLNHGFSHLFVSKKPILEYPNLPGKWIVTKAEDGRIKIGQPFSVSEKELDDIAGLKSKYLKEWQNKIEEYDKKINEISKNVEKFKQAVANLTSILLNKIEKNKVTNSDIAEFQKNVDEIVTLSAELSMPNATVDKLEDISNACAKDPRIIKLNTANKVSNYVNVINNIAETYLSKDMTHDLTLRQKQAEIEEYKTLLEESTTYIQYLKKNLIKTKENLDFKRGDSPSSVANAKDKFIEETKEYKDLVLSLFKKYIIEKKVDYKPLIDSSYIQLLTKDSMLNIDNDIQTIRFYKYITYDDLQKAIRLDQNKDILEDLLQNKRGSSAISIETGMEHFVNQSNTYDEVLAKFKHLMNLIDPQYYKNKLKDIKHLRELKPIIWLEIDKKFKDYYNSLDGELKRQTLQNYENSPIRELPSEASKVITHEFMKLLKLRNKGGDVENFSKWKMQQKQDKDTKLSKLMYDYIAQKKNPEFTLNFVTKIGGMPKYEDLDLKDIDAALKYSGFKSNGKKVQNIIQKHKGKK